MSNKINIAIIGLGQIGNYLLNELNKNKREILIKTGKQINIAAISSKFSFNLLRSTSVWKEFFLTSINIGINQE